MKLNHRCLSVFLPLPFYRVHMCWFNEKLLNEPHYDCLDDAYFCLKYVFIQYFTDAHTCLLCVIRSECASIYYFIINYLMIILIKRHVLLSYALENFVYKSS